MNQTQNKIVYQGRKVEGPAISVTNTDVNKTTLDKSAKTKFIRKRTQSGSLKAKFQNCIDTDSQATTKKGVKSRSPKVRNRTLSTVQTPMLKR